jgi:nucleotide-binding universal stress UspA family protein
LTSSYSSDAFELEDVVVLGRAHREILRLAAERAADLIVMGVRGRGAVDLTLCGSTTNQVVRRAACPVATIKSRDERAS